MVLVLGGTLTTIGLLVKQGEPRIGKGGTQVTLPGLDMDFLVQRNDGVT